MDEPFVKKRKLDKEGEDNDHEDGEIPSEGSSLAFSEAEDGELPDSDSEESKPILESTPTKNLLNSIYTQVSLVRQGTADLHLPTITPSSSLPKSISQVLKLPILPQPTSVQLPTFKPKSCPIVLPFPPHLMNTGGQCPLNGRKSVKESTLVLKELDEAYSKTYSDENSEKSDVSDSEAPTMESSSFITKDSVDIPTGITEPSTDELQRTVIENPNIKESNPNDMEGLGNFQDEEKVAEAEDFELYTKEVVQHRGGTWTDNKDPIPDGWTVVNHHCGFPLYLHRESRVATWARPYYIGASNVKNHKVPICAIPCLAYTKKDDPAEEVTTQQQENPDPESQTDSQNPRETESDLPSVQAKIVHTEHNHLESQKLKDYISKRFIYEEVQGKRYKDQMAYNRFLMKKRQVKKGIREARKKEKKANFENTQGDVDDQDLPTLVKTCIEIKTNDAKGKPAKPITIYLQGKSTVQILNEYCNRAFKCQPHYTDVRDDPNGDSQKFVVRLPDGKSYGEGEGQNRTIAKNIAALETLKLLIPGFEPDDKFMLTGRAERDYAYFDHLLITDNRLHQLCGQAGIPAPYQFLKDIIHKIHGPAGAEEHLDIITTVPNDTRFIFTLGNDKVEGKAKSKKNAKHIAAQQMLAKLHPELKTWGDLLKHYKSSETDDQKLNSNEKNSDEEQITALFKEKSKGPNLALLAKLREMMQKVSKDHEQRFPNGDRIAPLFSENRFPLGSNF